jgi:hypothetical protein
MGSSPGTLERALPEVPEALARERLRWEKELLGLYLSEHPLGALAEQIAQYVTAYSGDLRDESLDGQRVVMGGIVTGVRTVTTRSKETMAVATLEDLQGTLEVVVFPRMYATSGGTFAEGAILLVAGRVDHRGEEASLLADAVWVWEDAAGRGPEAIAQEVAAGERGRGSRRSGSGAGDGNGNGNGAARANGGGNGRGYGKPDSPADAAIQAVASTHGVESSRPPAEAITSASPATPGTSAAAEIRVSPLRGGGSIAVAQTPPVAAASFIPPSEPLSSVPAPDDLAALAPEREEPPLPDEARAVAARASAAPTTPLEASASGILYVRFTRGAETARIVQAMEELRAMLKERPGETRVVFFLPQVGGAALPMEVRGGVAYDAELPAEVRRRLGEGLVRLDLSTPSGR